MSAYPPNEPFTVSEKVELLVNVLQSLVPDLPSYLLHLILVDLQLPPRWMDMALPKGRTLHSCQIAFEEMKKQHAQQPGLARPYAPSTPYVNIAPHPSGGPHRSISEQNPHLVTARPLVPRSSLRTTESPHPPVTNGESPIIIRNPMLEPAPEASRKRGRPSKAEVEERTRRLAAEGKEYQPKKRAKKMRASLPPESAEPKEEESATPLLQTPSARAPEPPAEDSSNGKRRSKRQTREESPTVPTGATTEGGPTDEGQEPEPSVAESPSDRLLASHRNRGSVGSSLSRHTQQESDTLEQSQLESEFPP